MMDRDVLRQLIRFQHNASQLSDDQFLTLCTELILRLPRKQTETILFCGLNAMRRRSHSKSVQAQNIINIGTNLIFNIQLRDKLIQKHTNLLSVIHIPIITLLHLPPFLIKYLCDYLDIQSLLNFQITTRYFCVITREHRNYSLLLSVSPYHPTNNLLKFSFAQNQTTHPHSAAQHQSNGEYLHSVNENSLNSGYFKRFFFVIKKLGTGSYGQVFLVKHIMHNIYLGQFAIKLICVGDDVNRLIDILREVRALQLLHHRNVIDYKHSWLENYQPSVNGPDIPTLFILMEYADMGSILDYILVPNPKKSSSKLSRKWLTEHEIWTIMFETCMGLRHLHQQGIVHRDIKPGNILMTSLHKRHKIEYGDLELYNTNYRILISDLGQVGFMEFDEKKCVETGNTGSFGFAPPELILVDRFEDECIEMMDIWSVGMLLYFLTFSRMPYEASLDDDGMEESISESNIDIKAFYKDVVSGKNELYFPSNHGRSQVMIDMIREICVIDPRKRPNLDAIILAIANILRSHQYISISYTHQDPNRMRALTAPSRYTSGSNNDQNEYDLGCLPVVKYVPKKSDSKSIDLKALTLE